MTKFNFLYSHITVHCPAGTFSGEKQKVCTACPRGFFQNRDRQGTCIRCPLGTYTREEGIETFIKHSYVTPMTIFSFKIH